MWRLLISRPLSYNGLISLSHLLHGKSCLKGGGSVLLHLVILRNCWVSSKDATRRPQEANHNVVGSKATCWLICDARNLSVPMWAMSSLLAPYASLGLLLAFKLELFSSWILVHNSCESFFQLNFNRWWLYSSIMHFRHCCLAEFRHFVFYQMPFFMPHLRKAIKLRAKAFPLYLAIAQTWHTNQSTRLINPNI